MTFHEVRPPIKTRLKGYMGSPEWFTEITPSASGFESYNQPHAYPLHEFMIPALVEEREIAAMITFHMAISQGRAHQFRVKDWDDYSIIDLHNTTRPSLGTYSGTEATFQLKKTYTIYNVTFDRTIKKPVHNGMPLGDGRNTVRVYVAGSKITEGTGSGEWTIDATTGIITIRAGGSSGEVTAEGEFDVPCRMDQGGLPMSPIVHGDRGVREIEPLKMVEVKL